MNAEDAKRAAERIVALSDSDMDDIAACIDAVIADRAGESAECIATIAEILDDETQHGMTMLVERDPEAR